MAEVIRMPKMSDTMEEGVIASWLKNVGEEVSSGDVLAEVETDKATMELESYQDGVLLHIGVEEKSSVPVDGVIAVIGEKGEDISSLLAEIASGGGGSDDTPEETAAPAPAAEVIDTSTINASVIRMPLMSDTMEEGVIASWLKNVGDAVSAGDILAEVETDKATMELEAYEDGVLLYVGAEAGQSVKVDGVLAVIGEKGADFEALLKADTGKPVAAPAPDDAEAIVSSPAPAAVPAPVAPAVESQPVASANGRIKASPLAKKLAQDRGLDISQISGTGTGGRIIKKDVENFTPGVASEQSTGSAAPQITFPPVVGEEGFEEVAASQMRKAIAKSLSTNQFTAPHFYLTMDIDMDRTISARKSINELSPVKISFNDIVLKAVAAALRKHPQVNTTWIDETSTIRTNHHIHVGVAMAIDDGLVVPVVKFADNKSLAQISAEVKDFGVKAKSKKLQLDEMQGNTFTVSNLGMFGITEFTSILNAPASCILAVGAIQQVPVVKDGEIAPGNVMKITLTCDHRTVDGAVGSAFLQTLKGLIEDPVRILI